jgi:hypothetical protein
MNANYSGQAQYIPSERKYSSQKQNIFEEHILFGGNAIYSKGMQNIWDERKIFITNAKYS